MRRLEQFLAFVDWLQKKNPSAPGHRMVYAGQRILGTGWGPAEFSGENGVYTRSAVRNEPNGESFQAEQKVRFDPKNSSIESKLSMRGGDGRVFPGPVRAMFGVNSQANPEITRTVLWSRVDGSQADLRMTVTWGIHGRKSDMSVSHRAHEDRLFGSWTPPYKTESQETPISFRLGPDGLQIDSKHAEASCTIQSILPREFGIYPAQVWIGSKRDSFRSRAVQDTLRHPRRDLDAIEPPPGALREQIVWGIRHMTGY